MATKVISTESEFLATFKVGDTFLHMESLLCKPTWVVQATIREFREDGWVVIEDEKGKSCFKTRHHVNDLTNRFHGVFTSKEDAEAYLAERKIAYETDPELIAEAAKAEKSFEDEEEEYEEYGDEVVDYRT